MERKGLESYSDEWMELNATRVPGVLWESIRSICRAWFMDSSAPNGLADLIDYHMRQNLYKKVRLANGIIAAPYEVVLNETGWHYRGDVLSDDVEPGHIMFNEDAIEEVLDPIDFIRDIDGIQLK